MCLCICVCMFIRYHLKDALLTARRLQRPLQPYIFWNLRMKKNHQRTQIQRQRHIQNAWNAQHLKSWWLTHSKFDDRYPTPVILFTPVTVVSNQGDPGDPGCNPVPVIHSVLQGRVSGFFVRVSKNPLPPKMYLRLIYLKFLLVLKRHSWEGQSQTNKSESISEHCLQNRARTQSSLWSMVHTFYTFVNSELWKERVSFGLKR